MIADRYDAFLFDLDGTIYRGDEPTPGAAETLERLRGMGKGLAFMTNNSSRSPEDIVEHLASIGVAVLADEVVSSAGPTADLLREHDVRRAFVIGEGGLRAALVEAGIELLDGEPDEGDAVVVGLDRSVDYARLRTAALLLERGARLVASNADGSFPVAGGWNWPGAGAILAAIETTTGETAEVVGKPNPPIFRTSLARAGGGRALVIGDRLDTDIEGARRLGWDSALVLTGVGRREDLRGAGFSPTYVLEDLRSLVEDRDEAHHG
jgi:phosphoglycolate/pyridoxal phosphate phosphatase family enzyme